MALKFLAFLLMLANGPEVDLWQEAQAKGTPLIAEIPDDKDHVQVTFVWKGDDTTQNVSLLGTLWMDTEENQLQNIPNTPIWYRTEILESDFRGVYFFLPEPPQEEPKWQPDPLNPQSYRLSADGPIFSELILPKAKNALMPRIKRLQGKCEVHPIKSTYLDNQRTLHIYLPPNYDVQRQYPLLILFDGGAYTNLIPTPTLLDQMITDNTLLPLVAVFIENPSSEARAKELPCHLPFAQFLAHELMPWLHTQYSLATDPQQIVLGGSSYGGLAASYTALLYPHLFGKVLCQSGAFWWKPDTDTDFEWLTKEYENCPRAPIQFYLTVGKHETVRWYGHPSVLEANHHFRDALRNKGYPITYSEYNGGHDYVGWRGTLAEGLKELLPSPVGLHK